MAPDGRYTCFFVATKVIKPKDFFLWHYGLFHGIHKTLYVESDNDDHDDDDDDDEIEVDYDADFEMARQLSLDLNGPSPSRSSRDGDGDDAPGSQLAPDDDDQVAKRGKKDGKKKKEQHARVKKTRAEIASPGKKRKKHDHGGNDARSSLHGDGDDASGSQLGLDPDDRDYLVFPSPFLPVASAQAATIRPADEMNDSQNEDIISSDADEVDFRNESALDAEIDQRLPVELSSMSAVEVWDVLFMNKKLKGGYLARSLFLAGKEVDSKICDPWIGSKTLCQRKQELSDQRKLFLQWASDICVLRWIRNSIFSIILAKPMTYKLLDVHHAEFPRKQSDDMAKDKGFTLTVLEATDDTMARIAHLACESECRTALHMIHDSKFREHVENKDLQITALWQDLADQFVNNVNWETTDLQVAQLDYMKMLPDGSQQMAKRVDASVAPYPGVTGDFVRETFLALKGMFKKVADACLGVTGCNTTGEELYGQVWKNYIKGKFIHFPRPEIAMYLFKLWNECPSLPKYCTKELKPEAACRVGVGANDTLFSFPVTPHGLMSPSSGSTTSTTGRTFRSTNLSGSASADTTASIDKLTSCMMMGHELNLLRHNEEQQKPKVLFTCLFLLIIISYIL